MSEGIAKPVAGKAPGSETMIYLILLGLLGLSYGLAQFRWGGWSWAIGLAIAFVKVGFIARDYMELRNSSSVVRIAAAAGAVWIAILFSLTLTDYISRDWMQAPSPWPQKRPEAWVSGPSLR